MGTLAGERLEMWTKGPVNSRTRADIHVEDIKALSLHYYSNSVYLEQFTFPFPPRPISFFYVGAKDSYMEMKAL